MTPEKSTLNTSPALAGGLEITCQLLLVDSVPDVKESLLPPAIERLLRTTCGVVLAP